AGGAENGAAPLQDPANIVAAEWAHVPVHEPVPAVQDPDDLGAVRRERPADDGTDDRIQPGAGAARREDADDHRRISTGTSACRRRAAPWAGTAPRRRARRRRRGGRPHAWR